MKRKTRMWSNLSAKIASIPMLITAVGVFILCVAYSIALSFTRSRYFPKFDFIGFDQYIRLWTTDRWTVSVSNLLIFGVLFIGFCLVIGFILAVLLDRNIRMEGVFRTIFLYPYALSFVVTGLIWQWMMDPALGIQNVVRNLGWESFNFAPLTSTEYAIYGVVIAAVWQGTGLIMCLMLAGLRGIDREIWKAARVDGIPLWRTYIFIIIPMIRPVIVTAVVLKAISVVRVYDLVVAQTGGGPGIATEVPAKFVIDHFTERGNVAIAMAAATMMLLPVLLLVGPWVYNEYVRRARA
ncbi:carbohydrate ABC transporter permease [Thalassospira sp. TSL5-1]|uniref:carbohydrate ABC transporter permease n=1 Tax=Thalassospira sp. TSL5-1 TaxID=1544451 RepID=UPI00093E7037|nr:sugar ABC transporter permease [Thalassospira sp. TSL5-1]OKH88792.1 sugar ABC transporter permease [Thalassospira sp. TSL5-1]